jgi:hypothetical protein
MLRTCSETKRKKPVLPDKQKRKNNFLHQILSEAEKKIKKEKDNFFYKNLHFFPLFFYFGWFGWSLLFRLHRNS